MALNQVGKLPRNVHNPSGTIIMRFSEFSYLETQPGSSSTRPLGYIFTHLPRARNVNLFDPIHLQYYQHLKNCVKPHEIKGLVVTYGWSSFPRYQLAQY